MQVADRYYYWEAEAIPRRAPAPIKTVEPRSDLCSFLGRDAWAVILNHQRHGVAFFSRSNSDRCRAAGILEGVIDQVGGRTRQQIFVAECCRFAITILDD